MAQGKDLGSKLGAALRKAVSEALDAGSLNVAVAANVGANGETTSVYSDQEVTVIQRDGHTQVIHHSSPSEPDI